MGSSGSTLQPALVRREQLRCDSSGVAKFRVCTLDGQPGRPGFYKIVCNVNINQVHVYGVRPDDSVTRAEFSGKMYAPANSITVDYRFNANPEVVDSGPLETHVSFATFPCMQTHHTSKASKASSPPYQIRPWLLSSGGFPSTIELLW